VTVPGSRVRGARKNESRKKPQTAIIHRPTFASALRWSKPLGSMAVFGCGMI